MNWKLIIAFAVFTICWIGLALLFEKMGFGEYERKLIEEDNKKNK